MTQEGILAEVNRIIVEIADGHKASGNYYGELCCDEIRQALALRFPLSETRTNLLSSEGFTNVKWERP